MFEKVGSSLKCDSNLFFGAQTYTVFPIVWLNQGDPPCLSLVAGCAVYEENNPEKVDLRKWIFFSFIR